ncbi:methyltransferase domain-containing protein [Vibrio sp. T187]|uniref:tRNA1(Val) (adenine(37)-N6)-methyltransferase n=1 Tax=Vibrio TaxID=662 RepID=UPI0010C98825|nr:MULTISPECIES: methyltransferase [Vibrio]MBW3697084.1 methyltransferase domain-containing protein [Vibrio sp. T187]
MRSDKLKTKGFNFKQFSIDGGQSGMPVSTDGVLLGAWAQFPHANNILDIGTGTGLLALMTAQRFTGVNVQAIDINQHAIEAALFNFKHSPWSPRIQLIQGDVLSHPFTEKFAGIICNPPYFNNGEQAKQQQRATARHTDTLAHQALIDRCSAITTEAVTASFILPITEGESFIALALQSGWYLSRRLDVKPTDTKPASRVLFELTKHPQETQYDHLTIRHKADYSDEFIALTKDFYLKM